MNNLYGQTQILGKATTTTQSIDNGLFNYVLPYNKYDFFSYSDISFSDIKKCSNFDFTDNSIDKKCDENPNRTDLTLKNSKGEEIKLNSNYCYSRELCRNKLYADQIISLDQNHGANDGQYLDVLTHTNLQTLNITNLTVGIVAMLILAFSYV